MFRGVICCSGGLYAVQEGYMLKELMMILVATNVVASRPPERQPTGTPTARANCTYLLLVYLLLVVNIHEAGLDQLS